MFLEDPWVEGFWWAAALGALGYLTLFLLAERPVALRPGRLAWGALAAVGLRLGWVALGNPMAAEADLAVTAALILAAGCLWLAGDVLVVRAKAEVLREQIVTACQGLFLACEEPKQNLFRLSAKDGTRELRVVPLTANVRLIRLPQPAGPGKIALLVQWLCKQYPGPIPRIRVVLKKE